MQNSITLEKQETDMDEIKLNKVNQQLMAAQVLADSSEGNCDESQ